VVCFLYKILGLPPPSFFGKNLLPHSKNKHDLKFFSENDKMLCYNRKYIKLHECSVYINLRLCEYSIDYSIFLYFIYIFYVKLILREYLIDYNIFLYFIYIFYVKLILREYLIDYNIFLYFIYIFM
jgi:hypothetical protein